LTSFLLIIIKQDMRNLVWLSTLPIYCLGVYVLFDFTLLP